MIRLVSATAILLGVLSPSIPTWAGQSEPQAAVVAGYERLREAGGHESAALGEILLGELNCLSCHRLNEGAPVRVSTKSAPDLRRVGRRASPDWIRSFVAAPHDVKPGTTMPAVLEGFAADDRSRLADELTHFLMEQSDVSEAPAYPAFRFRATLERGRDLYEAVGCVACHHLDDVTMTSTSVPLGNLAAKWNVEGLAGFLLDPESSRYGSSPSTCCASRSRSGWSSCRASSSSTSPIPCPQISSLPAKKDRLLI